MAKAALGAVVGYLHNLTAHHQGGQQPDSALLGAFLHHNDKTAFEALLRRHGPMVLRTCLRAVGRVQDAEDAFQATFLVLAQQAASIRKREALAGWLHGVALRMANQARRSAARRRSHEAHVPQLATPDPALCAAWREIHTILDEEIERLPSGLRGAFVSCCLENKSCAETAKHQGVVEATIWKRLQRARRLLQDRLTRRGVSLTLVLAATAVGGHSAPAAVPRLLAMSTAHAAAQVATGQALAGISVPLKVLALVRGVNRAMVLNQCKMVVFMLLCAGSVGAGISWTTLGRAAMEAASRPGLAVAQEPIDEPTPQPPFSAGKPSVSGIMPVAARPQAGFPVKTRIAQAANAQPMAPIAQTVEKERNPKPPGSVTFSGRVVGPDGRPVTGAKVYSTSEWASVDRQTSSPERATTGPDGRFSFSVVEDKSGSSTIIAASAPNLGVSWIKVRPDGKRDDLTIQLVPDDEPIHGEIVDRQGQPVAGARLRVEKINAAPGEDLTDWLTAVKAMKQRTWELEKQYLSRFTVAVPLQTTTDAGGRFRLPGIGRNCLVLALLEGPSIATEHLHILTQQGPPIQGLEFEGRRDKDPRRVTTYYGSSFRHAAAPTRPIVGVVRDKDTKDPLPDVVIWAKKLANHPLNYLETQAFIRTTTDARGRYELVGMPIGAGNRLAFKAPTELPYLQINADVPENSDAGPVTLDLDLKRGVWIEGKITDKATGKPVNQQFMGGALYILQRKNPNLRDYAGIEWFQFQGGRVEADGSYRLLGLPGPGVIAISGGGNYLPARERSDEYGAKGLSQDEFPDTFRNGSTIAVCRVNPPSGAPAFKRDLTVDPGWKFTCTVLGPDGKPLAGARTCGPNGRFWFEGAMPAVFTAWANPHFPLDIVCQHVKKGLIGVAKAPSKDGEAITVRMQPAATVVGRLVDTAGKPRASVELELEFQPKPLNGWTHYLPEPIKTDPEGRFRIALLAPDLDYRLSDGQSVLQFGTGLQSGETKDLGEVRISLPRHPAALRAVEDEPPRTFSALWLVGTGLVLLWAAFSVFLFVRHRRRGRAKPIDPQTPPSAAGPVPGD
jgi:RNA polymerase sigma factor (sigma-70 family)